MRDSSPIRPEPQRAFTLIELLAVIAIIGILTAITFGVVKGVNERAAIGQAKAELSTLSQALEQYKRQYGDYPQTGSSDAVPSTSTTLTAANAQTYLFNAMAGTIGPTLAGYAGKRFVDLTAFTQEKGTSPIGTTSTVDCFLDPWGRRYMYYYKTVGSATWTNSTYVLYSVGPDGTHTAPSSAGVVDYTATSNVDNIYANRN